MGRVGLVLLVCLLSSTVLAEPESAWGYTAGRPIGDVIDAPYAIGMTGEDCGVRVGLGRLTAAEHEIADGSFNLGTLGPDRVTVILPRGAIALLRVRDLNGRDAELLLRPIPQRTLETIR